MLSRAISIIFGSSCIGYEGCGGLFCSVAVKRAGHPGIVLTRFVRAGLRYPVFCTLIPRSASTPLIQGGIRVQNTGYRNPAVQNRVKPIPGCPALLTATEQNKPPQPRSEKRRVGKECR